MMRTSHVAAFYMLCTSVAFADIPTRTATRNAATTAGTALVATRGDTYVRGIQHRDTGLTATVVGEVATTNTEADNLEFDTATMMAVEDIRPGMKGYGLSVFSGIRPEKFEATVVGVRHRVYPDMDIILCQLNHPILTDMGVIAGMSGSPVYMDEKMIGAVAYGWTESKEALAGVTPIASMLKVLKSTPTEPLTDKDEDDGATYRAYNGYMQMRRDLAWAIGNDTPYLRANRASTLKFRGTEFPDTVRQQFGLPDEFEMRPLTAPIFVSGASPKTLDLLRNVFQGLDIQAPNSMLPVTTWSPSAPAQNSPGGPVADLKALSQEFAEGYGLAVPFVEGDMNMSGVGTVTYRKGNRLVAFGHPMFEYGNVRFPMAPARINAIVRNLSRPFKVGEPLGQIGMVRQDRQPAIGCLFGQTADMFSIRASVEDPRYRGKREFNYRVWNDREMGPSLAMVTLMESMVAASRSGDDAVALFNYALSFDDGTSFTKEDYVADQYGGGSAAVGAASDVGVMMTNPYRRVKMKSLDFNVKLADRYLQGQLLAGMLDKAIYRPGDQVAVEWEVQPYRKPAERMQYSFRLPDNLADGEYDLLVTDAGQRESIEGRRNPGGDRVFDYESLVRLLGRNFPRNKVYVTLQDEDTGAAVRGSEMPKLPSSIINTIEATVERRYYSSVRGNFLVDADVVTNYEISGRIPLTVKVVRQPGKE
ncbi:MAG: SpoIVB peptidase S55 domain-containing protein [Candidatus Sumerlaeaceae bacterium]